jgi:DNA-binding response OmpR family regulator
MMKQLHLESTLSPWPMRVALVEDDPMLRQEIELHLVAHGFDVHAANSASGLDDLNTRIAFDLYLIDLNLPGENGLSLCRRVRESRPDAGIVIMTARVALNDRIAGYKQGGADLYLTKPVSPDELVLVLLSLGRRLKQTHTTNEWSMSLRDRTLLGPDQFLKLRLTSKEKTILLALVQAKDNTLESTVLCDLFADEDEDAFMSKHALEELIARLRKKFKSVQAEGDEPAIKSVWGVGYQLCVRIKFVH